MIAQKYSDAVGQLILAHYEGRPSFEALEFKDGTLTLSGGADVYFSQFSEWPCHLQEAVTLARSPVLDIGCGAGRLALYLQSQEHSVTGIDTSPLAIEVCKRRGARDAHVLSLEKIESLGVKFKTFYMIGNGFGLFGTPQRARELLKDMYKVAHDDAVLYTESRGRALTKEEQDALRGGQISIDTLGIQSTFRVRFLQYASEWIEYISVTQEEMAVIVEATGWKLERVISTGESLYYTGVLRRE